MKNSLKLNKESLQKRNATASRILKDLGSVTALMENIQSCVEQNFELQMVLSRNEKNLAKEIKTAEKIFENVWSYFEREYDKTKTLMEGK